MTVAARVVALVVAWGLWACAPTDDAAPACYSETLPEVDVIVAGSGSNLPLVEALLAQWPERGAVHVLVPESIGSSGAVAALSDGVIDVGLVSRPLRPDEQRDDWAVVPFARTPVAVVRHAPGGEDALTFDALVAIFLGEQRTWADGTPIVPILREAGDSGEAVIAAIDPSLALVMDDARAADRWQVALTDQAMRTALVETPGAIGLLDLGVVGRDPSLAVVTLDGRHPSDAQAWPFMKTLSIVVPEGASDDARRLADWLTHPDRHEDVHALGWLAPL